MRKTPAPRKGTVVDADVLPPEASAKRRGGLAQVIDANLLHRMALIARRNVAELALPLILETLRKNATKGLMEVPVWIDDCDEDAVAVAQLEGMMDLLCARGFQCQPSAVEFTKQATSGYGTVKVTAPALIVSWRAISV